ALQIHNVAGLGGDMLNPTSSDLRKSISGRHLNPELLMNI
ncbi:hypothetical protein E2320_008403, partial [Naja naja]